MKDWYKNAIIYGVDVKLFYDGNDDGIGDFVGLTEKLDYIKSLGFDCLWILPFQPSGGGDNGYDVTDYYSIDPQYGTLTEFKKFVKEAKKRDIRVIIDLVVHHTSNLHPWFLDARQNPGSKYRDFYIWTKKVPEGNFSESIPAFPGVDSNVWKYDPLAKMFYFHRFYTFQPDLNVANKEVQEEILSIMKFWLGLGISGFRIDAATMLFERKGKSNTEVKNAEEFLGGMNKFVKEINPEAVLLGEADVTAEKVDFFFGNGGRFSLLLNFLLNRYIFLALARESAIPIVQEYHDLPEPSKDGEWVNFLRNLDELNIETLTSDERDDVFREFGKEPWMRIYNRGIRRRLATMFEGNLNRMKMAYSLIFSLTGVPMVVYGDEIGMGDYLDLPEREAVRIPMQWDSSPNGGFSKVPEMGLYRASLSVGPFRYDVLNVEDESKKKDSLLNHIKKLTEIRKYFKEIGEGFNLLKASSVSVLACASYSKKGQLITFHNFSKRNKRFKVDGMEKLKLNEVFSNRKYSQSRNPFEIDGYGYRWFEVVND